VTTVTSMRTTKRASFGVKRGVRMNDHLESSKSDVMGTISAEAVQPKGLNPKFVLFAVVLTLSLVGVALSIKRARVEYDSSASCLVNNEYTEVTKTEGSSTTHSYRVSYRFAIGGQTYSGTDEIVHEPKDATATVYFTAARPQENGLYPTHWNNTALIVAGIALVMALIAYWQLPKDYVIPAPTTWRQGVGDSGREHLSIERGKYNASAYVEFAFFGQVVLVGILIACLLSSMGLEATNDVVIIIAGIVAVSSTLWVYFDRWRCIEAHSSRFCSGIANFSMFYVPVVALVYANYRAIARLQGR
jgi:hypothetical protein